MSKKHSNILELCTIGLITSLLCVIAPLSIPLPVGVPITLQTFMITFIAIVLGAKRSLIATFLYVLLGALGLPVFSNYSGGWQMIIGPTGGFILSFPLMAYIIGAISNARHNKKVSIIVGVIIGTLINFLSGTIVFCFATKSSLYVGVTSCILPFIIPTIIKVCLACFTGIRTKKRLRNFIH